ncbi:MAG: hypothetical protein J6K61_07320 [Clostridia bacterium]|nr:hypothetical protein [Clostridia bacterium]
MKVIDIETWDRKTPYQNFVRYTDPIFSLSSRLDVTDLYNFVKKEGHSFFTDFLFLVATCLNRVEDFRLRINEEGQVVLFDHIHPNYIVMQENGVIATCRSRFTEDYKTFYAQAREDTERTAKGVAQEKFNRTNENDVFYISCLPWLDFVSVTNPYHFDDVPASTIPRLAWGKYVEENGRKRLTFDIAVHHALLDGKAVCDGFSLMSAALSRCEEFFASPTATLDKMCEELRIKSHL